MTALNFYSLFCWLIVCSTHGPDLSVTGQLISSSADMTKLLDTDRILIASLDEYLVAEEKRLQQLKDLRQKMSRIDSIASQDVSSYLANPYNAFILIKTVTRDWDLAQRLMIGGSLMLSQQIFNRLSNSSETFLSMEDFDATLNALLRLQKTYQLEVSSLARGDIQLRQPLPNHRDSLVSSLNVKKLELTAVDCFELGRKSNLNLNHYQAVLWLKEALRRYEEEEIKTVTKAEILDFLSYSAYQLGNIRHALNVTNELLKIKPDHPQASANKLFYQKLLEKDGDSKSIKDDTPIDFYDPMEQLVPDGESEWQIFGSLCRGEVLISPETASQLVCHYLNTSSIPHLRYSRIKVEEAFKKPLIQLYHDIISDNEIETFKNLTAPKLTKASVMKSINGAPFDELKYRISQITWLMDTDHEIVARLSQRIADITGLSLISAEAFQIGYYGLGGHYVPHYDFSRPDDLDSARLLGDRNRIATWLNYMSNVEAGGATVFPEIGISVFPRKGSAVFWHNLYLNGEGDTRTKHGACPILVGSKWISTKWFRERGQELLRPCGLAPDE